MIEVNSEIYTSNFDKIFDWFHYNVHVGFEEFDYEVVQLDGTHLKMVDIVRKSTGGLYYRVIIKSTLQDVEKFSPPIRSYKDFDYFNTKTNNEIIPATAAQICFIQLDEEYHPVHGILYTYSSNDEKYHEFKLPK